MIKNIHKTKYGVSYNTDCLDLLPKIPKGQIGLILCDPPYGTVKNLGNGEQRYKNFSTETNKWDVVIRPDFIFENSNNLLKMNRNLILFSQEPFTCNLITSERSNISFCYRMIWKKNHFGNNLLSNKAPVSYFEDIVVFRKNYDSLLKHPLREYFKSLFEYINLSKLQLIKDIGQEVDHVFRFNSTQFSLCTESTYDKLIFKYNIEKFKLFKPYNDLLEFNKEFNSVFNLPEGKKFKSNILEYPKDKERIHPTQKPLLLIEDLILTYSNEGDIILDFTSGSGTVALACIKNNRKYLCIEKDEKYFELSCKRIDDFIKSFSD